MVSIRTELSGDKEAGKTISHATVQYIIKKFMTGSVDNAKRQRRPRVISERETHQLILEISSENKIFFQKFILG